MIHSWRSPTSRWVSRIRPLSSTKVQGHFDWATTWAGQVLILERFSFGGPNDTFNRREQKTYSFSDNVTFITAITPSALERKSNATTSTRLFLRSRPPSSKSTTTLPSSCEAWRLRQTRSSVSRKSSFGFETRLLSCRRLEGEPQTDPERRPTLGVVWLAGREERLHRQLRSGTGHESRQSRHRIHRSFERRLTGFVAVDTAIHGYDQGSHQEHVEQSGSEQLRPTFGFAYTLFGNNHPLVIRGGYGIFFDRPSAAFINTVFSNYPHLREEEVTFPAATYR